MFLLNSLRLSEYIATEGSPLSINNFVEKNLQHTFYYFRLGSSVKKNGTAIILEDTISDDSMLTLEPGDFAQIWSHEEFRLSKKIFGIIGSNTDLAANGIQLLHSPFLDPGFKGRLKLGVANLSKKEFSLKFLETNLGKISFFNVSDSHPVTIEEDSIIGQKFKKRLLNQ